MSDAARRAPAPRVAGLAFLAVAVASGAACKGTHRSDVPDGELVIGDSPRIVTGPVGIGVKEKPATYVLVDVTNRGDSGAVVTLGGELLDAAEISLGALRTETLRIGPGETRLFALIDAKIERLETTAETTRVTVTKATRPEKGPGAVVSQVTEHEDEGRAVVGGYVENLVNGPVKVVVHAGFYDAEGRPMMRQSTLYNLDKGGKRSAQFVGPVGSKRASLFIGDIGR